MIDGRSIVAIEYQDGSDLNYQALYFLPEGMTPQMFARLSAHYETLEEENDKLKYELGFTEWALARCGVVIERIEPDFGPYDAWTGEIVW